jgi:hypothetical protein
MIQTRRLEIRPRRPAAIALAVLAATLGSACATYSQDLERVRRHYDRSEFPASLALLRALGDDQAGLSERERVEYAYLRGMTDYRLAAASPSGPTRDAFRQYAADYLSRASKLDAATPTALSAGQKERMRQTLAALATNADIADE